jgi:hypothetical protein
MIALNAEHPGDKPASSNTAPVILLTGRPGIGKTTAIRHVVDALGRLHPAPLGNRAGGFEPEDLIEGVQWSSIDLLGQWTLEADRVATF